MNLSVTFGMIQSIGILNFGADIVLAEIHTIELALIMLIFLPLWFINLCVLNTLLSFIMSVPVMLFSTSEHEIPKRFTALLAVIPTCFELYWLSLKLGIGTGYWGAFSW